MMFRDSHNIAIGDTVIRPFKAGSGKVLDIKDGKAQVNMHGKNKRWYPLWKLQKI